MEPYATTIVGLLLLCAVLLVLGMASGMMKGQAGLPGGAVADARHDNLIFRVDRTHVNSVESVPAFVLSAILALLMGVAAGWLALLVWVYLGIRLAHAAVYLRGGTLARGGGVRTLLHVAGTLCNLAVIVLGVVAAV